MQHCFRNCNDLTVHMIAFELIKTREFKPGEVILPMNKRSSINPMHKASLLPQTNAILKSVLKAREDIDKFGIDRRVSSWQLMLQNIAGMARKAIEMRASVMLKSKILKMQKTFDPPVHVRKPSSSIGQNKNTSVAELMQNYEHVHNVNSDEREISKNNY